jgi:hypothetical protein
MLYELHGKDDNGSQSKVQFVLLGEIFSGPPRLFLIEPGTTTTLSEQI